mmetsp:Transcript_13932/g.13458  ORF Transcript_13932/g.13458 Transcript_13932/m.13458 type:complete len:131 (+) Transcript_13932:1276-1668(+)
MKFPRKSSSIFEVREPLLLISWGHMGCFIRLSFRFIFLVELETLATAVAAAAVVVMVKIGALAVVAVARIMLEIGTTAALLGIESLATTAAARINTSILNGSLVANAVYNNVYLIVTIKCLPPYFYETCR